MNINKTAEKIERMLEESGFDFTTKLAQESKSVYIVAEGINCSCKIRISDHAAVYSSDFDFNPDVMEWNSLKKWISDHIDFEFAEIKRHRDLVKKFAKKNGLEYIEKYDRCEAYVYLIADGFAVSADYVLNY